MELVKCLVAFIAISFIGALILSLSVTLTRWRIVGLYNQMKRGFKRAIKPRQPLVIGGGGQPSSGVTIEPLRTNIYFNWGSDRAPRGFGQLSVALQDGQLTCMNECLSRESVRKLLHAYADYVADNVVLLEQ